MLDYSARMHSQQPPRVDVVECVLSPSTRNTSHSNPKRGCQLAQSTHTCKEACCRACYGGGPLVTNPTTGWSSRAALGPPKSKTALPPLHPYSPGSVCVRVTVVVVVVVGRGRVCACACACVRVCLGWVGGEGIGEGIGPHPRSHQVARPVYRPCNG